jgi:hypothetical protein
MTNENPPGYAVKPDPRRERLRVLMVLRPINDVEKPPICSVSNRAASVNER